uniref:C-type lectin domain-containing protein n=1 Tax=Anolis carolinensis TaxID=28377 RepID=A0A803TXM4_ANOCA
MVCIHPKCVWFKGESIRRNGEKHLTLALMCSVLCSDGWDKFQEKCYYFTEEQNPWQQSREMCQSKGADLIVIDHKEKQVGVSYFFLYRK